MDTMEDIGTAELDELAGDMPEPTAADRAPRRTEPDEPHDPEAPYGWTKDRRTGEVRPRKWPVRTQPGRSRAKGTTAPPRKRAANRPRTVNAPPAGDEPGTPGSLGPAVASLVDTVWMLAAQAPKSDKRVGRLELGKLSTLVRAEAAVIATNRDGLVHGLTLMADNSEPVGRAVSWLTDSSGPAWIPLAVVALTPFIVQTAQLMRAPTAVVEAWAQEADKHVAHIRGAHAAVIAADELVDQGAALAGAPA